MSEIKHTTTGLITDCIYSDARWGFSLKFGT